MKNTLYCTFCGKSQYEIKKLIAGPTVFICDECIALCVTILFEEGVVSLPFTIPPERILGTEKLEQIHFSSIDDFLSKGGIEKREGPYSGGEIMAAVCAIFTPMLYVDARARAAEEIRSQLTEIDGRAQQAEQDFETERAILRDRLKSMGQEESGD